MKIRAVTLGLDLPAPEVVAAPFDAAARFLTAARQAFAALGVEVQTTRLPVDVSEAELTGAYLDVAALSVALNQKPLTARLLPVPGARAGDMTAYTFDYFSNTLIPPSAGAGAAGIVARGQ